MVNINNIRRSLCEIGKLLYVRQYIDASGGNISVRDGDKVYITPRLSGENHQWSIDEDSIIVTDLCKVPLIGDEEKITREASSHYLIYQNFADIGAIVHAHPPYMMSFGAAHMDLPAISEGTRCVLGEQPITNIEESVPGSMQQGERVVENFKKRRKSDTQAPLICGIPFHGIFAAGPDLNQAFLYTEVAEIGAKIIINRQIMFGNDPKADFSIHQRVSKEDVASISITKPVCEPGYKYKDAFGNSTTFKNDSPGNINADPDLIKKITEEVLRQLKNR
jgi:L-fuculose-phosphate aldolase